MSAESQSPPGYKLCPQCRQIYAASVELCPNDHARLIIERRILVGKYILLNRLGAGPGSEVYAAEQPQLGRMVAIKLLPRDPEIERSFDSQVRSIGTVKHEHVVTLYDSGRADDGRPYIAMEYLEGENLAERLVRTGAMAADRALILWRQAVSAIAAAHRRHIVHGDINPTNLFLTQRESAEGSQEVLKVIDFRIGPRSAAALASDAAGRGSSFAHYVAPEQLHSGSATTRADVYSLGLVLLEMLNGRLPRESAISGKEEVSQGLLLQLAQAQATSWGHPRPVLSSELLTLLGEILRRDPARRPADAVALLQLVRKLPDVGALSSSAGIRIIELEAAASQSPPSQQTEPDWLAGAKNPKDRKSSGGINPLTAAPVVEAVVPSDVLETPNLGVDTVDDPPWLTETMEQQAMRPPFGELALRPPLVAEPPHEPPEPTGPTLIPEKSAEEFLDPDPFVTTETPQMGVAVLSGLLRQIKEREHLSDPVSAVPRPKGKPAPHWSRIGLRIFAVVLVFGTLGGGLAFWARTRWSPAGAVNVRPDLGAVADAATRGAPVPDLKPADLTAADPGRDAGAGHPVDLGSSAGAAGAADGPAADSIKLRFVYDENTVDTIECNQESQHAPSSSDKHGAGVEATLRAGNFCRATGPYGSKTYRYETLLPKRMDASGVRRIRVRWTDASDADAPSTKKPAEEKPTAAPTPAPTPPAAEGGS